MLTDNKSQCLSTKINKRLFSIILKDWLPQNGWQFCKYPTANTQIKSVGNPAVLRSPLSLVGELVVAFNCCSSCFLIFNYGSISNIILIYAVYNDKCYINSTLISKFSSNYSDMYMSCFKYKHLIAKAHLSSFPQIYLYIIVSTVNELFSTGNQEQAG